MKKIPLKYAALLGCSKSFLVRVNQGKRRLSIDLALKLVEMAPDEFELLELRPDLKRLIPFLSFRLCELCQLANKDRLAESILPK